MIRNYANEEIQTFSNWHVRIDKNIQIFAFIRPAVVQ